MEAASLVKGGIIGSTHLGKDWYTNNRKALKK